MKEQEKYDRLNWIISFFKDLGYEPFRINNDYIKKIPADTPAQRASIIKTLFDDRLMTEPFQRPGLYTPTDKMRTFQGYFLSEVEGSKILLINIPEETPKKKTGEFFTRHIYKRKTNPSASLIISIIITVLCVVFQNQLIAAGTFLSNTSVSVFRVVEMLIFSII